MKLKEYVSSLAEEVNKRIIESGLEAGRRGVPYPVARTLSFLEPIRIWGQVLDERGRTCPQCGGKLGIKLEGRLFGWSRRVYIVCHTCGEKVQIG